MKSFRWVEDVMAVVEDVDWADLHHAYGSAAHTPIALRAWLRGDERSWDDIGRDDEVFPVIIDHKSQTVAQSALAWIYVSVFHQGSLYSASAPVCRAMVAAMELSPVQSVQIDALHVLDYALTLGDDRQDWRADGFHRLAFRDIKTYDEIELGLPHYLRAIGNHQSDDRRRAGARILAWMSDRARCAEEIVDVLAEEPVDDIGSLEAAVNAEITAMLIRTLGLVARDTPVQDQAELGIRSFLHEAGDVGLAAALALARLRRVDEGDSEVIASLQAELEAQGEYSDMGLVLVDALVTIALHCAPAWTPRVDRGAAARRIGEELLHSLTKTGDDVRDQVRLSNTRSLIRNVANHHRLNDEVPAEATRIKIMPVSAERAAHSAAVDTTRFAFGSGRLVHLVSIDTLTVGRTLTTSKEPDMDSSVVAKIDSSQPETLAHWADAEPSAMSVGELVVSPDGRWLGASGTGQVAIWDLQRDEDFPVAYLGGFTPKKVEFAWSPDSLRLVTAEAGDVHLWSVEDWSRPMQVGVAITVERLAWTGPNPYLITRNEIHCWKIASREVERIELPPEHYPSAIGPAGRILVSLQPQWLPSKSAMWDDTRWVRFQGGLEKHLVVNSSQGQRRVPLQEGGTSPGRVWWWPDGRMFVHQYGHTATFRNPEGGEIASCALVDTEAGDLVWTATDSEENPLISSTRDDVISLYRRRPFDRPMYYEDPSEIANQLAKFKNTPGIIEALGHRSQ